MSLSCFRSLNPNISNMAQLYDDRTDNGFMYLENGTPPPCSSVHPPEPSNCTVCFTNQFIYAVCSDLKKNVKLMLEADGKPMDLTKSECPGLFLATNENVDLSSDDMGSQKWWWLLPLFLLIILIVIGILAIAFKKYAKKIQEWMRPRSHNGRLPAPRSSIEPRVVYRDGSAEAHIPLSGVRVEERGGIEEEP